MKLLLTAGVTPVAEAAFQDRLWRPGLEPLADLADIRIVHCIVDRKVAAASLHQRHPAICCGEHIRTTIEDAGSICSDVRPSLDRRSVDRRRHHSSGYLPGLDEIIAFVNGRRSAHDHA
jgi:hypothetical protein